MKNIYILGISGTFMGGLAALAKELGYAVSGADQNIYPPMSTQLEQHGIDLHTSYSSVHITKTIQQIVIGNALSRGNPIVEHVLNQGIPYISGPQWLAENILQNRYVLAVAGTHGKTTTSSLLAWILDYAQHKPGFLIGGVPENFNVSARIGQNADFVIEADEYDSAFFDKRSKFIHYRPHIAILNNLEFDHADIFENISAIEQQFHYFIRTIPSTGKLIVNADDQHLKNVIQKGCWTPIEYFSITDTKTQWYAKLLKADGSQFQVYHSGKLIGEVVWSLLGNHNVMNGLAAIAAACARGVKQELALSALPHFLSPKRRLEILARHAGISVYDDFAHHPTAIATTLHGLRHHIQPQQRILAVLESRSNSMRLGAHATELPAALSKADYVFLCTPQNSTWRTENTLAHGQAFTDANVLLENLQATVQPGDHVVFMSNGGFEQIPHRFATWLLSKA